jgi:ribose 5-phosphate isomerase B
MPTKRFDIITEADARVLEPGTTVQLTRGGHVTPLAQDTLRARRITVLREDGRSAAGGGAPPADVRRVAIGSDHTGVDLKRSLVEWLRGRGLQVEDVGTAEKGSPVDYPDIAAAVARLVGRGDADAGIVIDGAGIGSAIAANKIRGVRAAMCTNETLARYAREHNGANVLTLGATLVTAEEARRILERWLTTAISEPRYLARLNKIRALES